MRQVELIGKKEFTAAALDLKDEAFVVQVAYISQNSDVHPTCQVEIVMLEANQAFISVYLNILILQTLFSKI